VWGHQLRAAAPHPSRGPRDVFELLGVTVKLLAHSRDSLFDEWCVADADLALMLMRLVANEDPVPERVSEYALAQWQRQSIRRYLAHIRTTP
jgi:glutathione S-transferase